jgi:hypothetical protein
LALDESTDVQDNLKFAVFVHYVSIDIVMKEEMLELVALKEITGDVSVKKNSIIKCQCGTK